jgi:hypothetical protein
MGKKKKKPKHSYNQGYDQKELNRIADSLEEYVDHFDTFIIRDGLDEEKYKKAIKTIRKAIKNLRAGNGDDVFDRERYSEMVEARETMGNSDND